MSYQLSFQIASSTLRSSLLEDLGNTKSYKITGFLLTPNGLRQADTALCFFPIFGTDYYAGLITDATEIPSLRYVLEDMLTDPQFKRKDMQPFFRIVQDLAKTNGDPLKATTPVK